MRTQRQSMQDAAVPVSSGVEALIERLRDEGVSRGREEAAHIVEDARAEAARLCKAAVQEAEALRSSAREEARREQEAGRDALRAAARDAMLEMKQVLTQRFVRDVERLVGREMAGPELLRQMILEVVRRARQGAEVEAASEVEVVLSQDAISLDELRRDPEELQESRLSQFVLKLSHDALREGVVFSAGPSGQRGIRVRLVDRQVELDLTDTAVAGILLQHLAPRFRAILEGLVR